jgi:hypothetical protein
MIAPAKTTGPRYRQLERMFLLIELIAPLRYGATIGEIAGDVRAEIGDYCERTIRRDLLALQELGVVERLASREPHSTGGYGADRWRWIDCSIRSVIYRHVAESQASY